MWGSHDDFITVVPAEQAAKFVEEVGRLAGPVGCKRDQSRLERCPRAARPRRADAPGGAPDDAAYADHRREVPALKALIPPGRG
ncbi:hypothetical protein C8E95_1041 [Pseudonocardia autotrophica]|uniref:Uncharacterized protein n=2 Tax=Pseudonocardia TaxID=1847 RepID=A0A1Y2N196_PSEAH|nr:hypothetical protein BG845_02446 [Pseudonocardia autotrophica]TDN72003.1 hypothetical protein C8E95_1041 [Pseudonocardia autotrophica]BBG02692.1 hypothetical protein Pdca_39010 [Pseudonocardia autotrophica]GEC29381.1 hypothetical protein PSA01_64100 [Pseudonocardia saturnea]